MTIIRLNETNLHVHCMTDDKLDISLSANTIMAKLTSQFERTRHITSSPDKFGDFKVLI